MAPAFVPVLKGIHVVLTFLIQGSLYNVTISVESAGTPTATDLQNATDVPINWWATSGKTPFSNQTALAQAMSYDLTTVNSPTHTNVVSSPVFGGVTGSPVEAATCIVESKRTNMRGKSFRGRAFWVGMPSAGLLDAKHWTAATITAIAPLFLALDSALSTAGLTRSVFSRFSGKDPVTGRPLPRSTGIITPINATRVDSTIGIQRRRVQVQ